MLHTGRHSSEMLLFRTYFGIGWVTQLNSLIKLHLKQEGDVTLLRSEIYLLFFFSPLKTQIDLDHPDWVMRYVMPRNPTQAVLWVFVWCMCKGSEASKEEMPNLLWHCTQEMGKICWDVGSPSAVRVGWRLSLRRVGKRERLSSAVVTHLFVCPLSDKGPRDCWDLCPNGKTFILSLFSSLLSPLGYEAPASGLAKNIVQSVQSPESSATNLHEMTNNRTSQKSN